MCDCGQEMKFIKAGVSKKTGKPYQGFFTCDTCHKTARAAQVSNQGAKMRAEVKSNTNDQERTDAILVQVALKCATELHKHDNVKDIKIVLHAAEIMNQWLQGQISGKKQADNKDFLDSQIPF